MEKFLNISNDAFFFIAVLAILFVYTMYFGRGRMVSLILAFYPATLLYKSFPFIDKLTFLHGSQLVVLNQIAIFLLFLVPLAVIIDRFIFSTSEYTGSSHILRTLGLSLAGVIIIVIFSYSTVSFDSLHDFGGGIDSLFSSTAKIFYWNLAPAVLLGLL